MAVTPRDERNAVPDEHRDNADDEFVDRVFVEKGGDEVAATHQPDILAALLAKPAHELADRTADELHPFRGVGGCRRPGEDDGAPLLGVERRSQPQALLVSLSSEHGRVDGLYEGVDRKSTRLNSSHSQISYAVFCLKKKRKKNNHH